MPDVGPGAFVVVGGGIGGLAAAIAIRRAGREVVVVEREGARREAGAGLSIWPNAMGVLDRLGVGDAVRARSVPTPETVLRRSDGRVLAGLQDAALPALLGDDLYVIDRADLLAVLQAAVDADGLLLGTEACAVDAHDDGTASVALGGGGRLHGAGVVGADGVTSLVARWMHPEVRPRYAGWTAWRGIATFAASAEPRPPYAETWSSDGRRFGVLPLPEGRVYWYATANRPEGERAADAAAEHAALVRDLCGWHPPVAEVLAATDPAAVLRHDVYDREPLPSWVRSAVCLLGDAAHPMQPNLGQGACQALEDAEVLGACVAAEPTAATAFARYEAVRKHHADRVVALSRRAGRVAQATGARARLRDFAAGLVPPSAATRALKRFAARTAGPCI